MQFGYEGTLARTLRAAIRAPSGTDLADLIARLSRERLLVTPWMAEPELRSRVAALRWTPDGLVVREQVFPMLCLFALRLAWDEVAPRPEMDLYRVAHDLHSHAMTHLMTFLDQVAEDPASAARAMSAPRRHREYFLAGVLDLRRALRPGWRRRRAIMLGVTLGALRMRRWRLTKSVTPPPRSTAAKSKT
jgi:hypothetical protein